MKKLAIPLLAYIFVSSSFAVPLDNVKNFPKEMVINLNAKSKNAQVVFNKYGCLNCHTVYPPPRTAPSFWAIKNRYLRYFNGNEKKAKEYIKNVIRNGSKGRWYRFGLREMPAYSTLPDKDLEEIVNTIFKLGF
jgi:cytochrome c551/c552